MDVFVARMLATYRAMHKIATRHDDARMLYCDLADLSNSIVDRLALEGAGAELADAMVELRRDEVERLAVMLAARCLMVVNFCSERVNLLRAAADLLPLGHADGVPQPGYHWAAVSSNEHQLRSGTPHAPLGSVVRYDGRFFAAVHWPPPHETLAEAQATVTHMIDVINADLAYVAAPTAATPTDTD